MESEKRLETSKKMMMTSLDVCVAMFSSFRHGVVPSCDANGILKHSYSDTDEAKRFSLVDLEASASV